MASLAIEQTLALAMARHARLGAASSAFALEADTLALIFSFVRDAHEKLVATKRIVGICVQTSSHAVQYIEINYSDGTRTTHGRHVHHLPGTQGGCWQEPLKLQPGEIITRVAGRHSDSGHIDAIEFTTSRGGNRKFVRTTPRDLKPRSSPFGWNVAAGYELADLSCSRATLYGVPGFIESVDALEVVETPWTSRMARLLIDHPSTSFPPLYGPFIHRVGALYTGHDIDVRICTLEEAKARALELPNCAGFTFHSTSPQFTGAREVFFKDRRDGNTDIAWQTCLRPGWRGPDPAPTPWPEW